MEAPDDIERLRVKGQGLRVGYCSGRLARGMKLSVIVRYLTYGNQRSLRTDPLLQERTFYLENPSALIGPERLSLSIGSDMMTGL